MQSSFRRSLIYFAKQYGLYSIVNNCIMDRKKCSISLRIFVPRQDTSRISEIEGKIRFRKFEIFKTQNRLLKIVDIYLGTSIGTNIYSSVLESKNFVFSKTFFQSVSETQGYQPGFTKHLQNIEIESIFTNSIKVNIRSQAMRIGNIRMMFPYFSNYSL